MAKGLAAVAAALSAAGLLGWLPDGAALRSASVPRPIYGVPASAEAPTNGWNSAIGCSLGGEETPLPIRLTITWNAATKRAKVYVGQSFTGYADDGGIERAIAKSLQILRVCGPLEIELDADSHLPAAVALEMMQRHLDADPTLIRIAAWGSDEPSAPQGSLPAGTLPHILGARQVGRAGHGWTITLDHRTRMWLAGGPGDASRLIPPRGLQRWASQARRRARSRNPRILIAVPASAEWRDILQAIYYLRQAGITDIAFVTAAPTAQPGR